MRYSHCYLFACYPEHGTDTHVMETVQPFEVFHGRLNVSVPHNIARAV